jgi:hypothetical protein
MTTKVNQNNNILWTNGSSPVTNGFETISGNVGAIPQGTTNWLLGWTRF